MTVRGAADVASLLVDGYDILGTVTEIEDKQYAVTEQTNALGDAWEEHSFVGIRRAEITQRGFYDDAAGSVHAALATGPGNSSRVLTYQPAGTATGSNFKGMTAVQVDYAVEPGKGVLHKANAMYHSNGRFDEGKVLWTYGAAAGDSATASPSIQRRDAQGATIATSSTNGGAAYFQLTAFTSGANATGVRSRIQHSSDDVTFADLVTFTIATAAPFAQRAVVATGTAIECFLRMASSFQGGSSAQMTGFWGFARY